jgi:hypothetical protein
MAIKVVGIAIPKQQKRNEEIPAVTTTAGISLPKRGSD